MNVLKTRMDMSDMNMGDTETSGASGMMKQYFHGTLNDTLWFTSWTPTTGGGFAGACIVLFFLAVVERFLHAVRASAEVRWKARIQTILLPSSNRNPRPSPPQNNTSSSSSSISSTQNDKDNEKPIPSTSKDVDPSSSTSPVPTLPSSSNANDAPSQPDGRNRDPLPAVLDLLPGRRARWAPPFVWKIDVVRGAMQAVQLGVHYLLMLAVMTFNIYFFIVILAGAGVGETLFGRFGSGHL